LFHRDDLKTTKSCPGRLVGKQWVLDLINKTDIDETCRCLEPKETPKQFVPAAAYLQEIKNYSMEEIALYLKRDEDGLFYFKGIWLEGAYYDKNKKATIAPISELSDVPKKK
jgi:hypothetical protein